MKKSAKKFGICPFCGASVKIENMLEHKIRIHSKDLISKGKSLRELGMITEEELHTLCDKASNLMFAGEVEKAAALLEEVLKVDPNNFGAWNDLGLALGHLGRNREALNSFDRCIEINPHIAHAWHNKGNLLLISLGREDEALRCYEEALKCDPQILQAWYNKGTILLSKKRYEDAVKCFDEAIKLNDEYYLAWMAKALALNVIGNANEREKCFRRAYELNPEFVWKFVGAWSAGERRLIHTSRMDAKKTKK